MNEGEHGGGRGQGWVLFLVTERSHVRVMRVMLLEAPHPGFGVKGRSRGRNTRRPLRLSGNDGGWDLIYGDGAVRSRFKMNFGTAVA